MADTETTGTAAAATGTTPTAAVKETTGTTVTTDAVKETTAVKEDPTFTKEQLAVSKKYIHQADIINAVLKEGQTYTIAAADAAVKAFLEKDFSYKKKVAK